MGYSIYSRMLVLSAPAEEKRLDALQVVLECGTGIANI
jgi:hypothetical protein